MACVHLALARPRRIFGALAVATLVVVASLVGPFGAAALAAGSKGHETASPERAPSAAAWPVAGGNASNTRDAATEQLISPKTVARLHPLWTLEGAGNDYTTPTVVKGMLYTPSASGRLSAIDAKTGAVEWSTSIASYTGVSGDVSRNSPAYSAGELVLGDRHAGTGAKVFAVSAGTGARRWVTTVSTHPAAYITASPEVVDGVVYVGVSSNEEGLAAIPGYPCCTFRGSVVALSAATGKILWQTSMAPPNQGKPGGYSGDPVWGSTPVADPIFSILTLGLFPCGADYDIGQGPSLYTTTIDGKPVPLLGIGAKSGIYRAYDPSNGHEVWQTRVGPGGALGGIMFGSAVDGSRVYVAETDSAHTPYTIKAANGATKTITGGSWAALDAATGKLLWQTADPQGALDEGMVTVADGVVFAPSNAGSGNDMYALDARTGQILRAFPPGARSRAAPASSTAPPTGARGTTESWRPSPPGDEPRRAVEREGRRLFGNRALRDGGP